MDDHLPQAVVAELQQEDLPSPAILLKSNAPRDLLHLDVVNEQSTGNNDVSPKPVAKRIMKRKESRGKRSSSQSSSRGVTPDPGHKRFNPRTDGLAAFYQCLLRLFNQSSDGTILWNDLRTVYRKETTRHLNSEELNLISGTHGRTKNDLLATRLSCLIEPLDSKGQIVRLAVNSDGSPVPLPSPMTSDDDSSSTRQSLSRLASIDDEEQQRIIMDEKRREITEGLIRRGLLNPDGSRSTIITEKADEEYADLPELVADAANSVVDDVMEKTAEEKSITQYKMTNDEKDPILEGLPSAEGIAQVVKMVEGVEPVTTETSLLNNDVKQVTAGVVEMRDEAIGEIQAKASEIKIDAPATVEVSEKKLSIVNVPSIEITQYSDNEADTEEIEEKTASEIAEELVASVLADSVDSMKDDLVVKDEEELVSDVHAVLDNISDTTVSSPEDGPVKRSYTLEETAHYLLDSDFDSESEKERRRAMNFPMEKTEDEEVNGLHAEQTPVHEISGSDSKTEVREHNVLYTDEEEAEQMVSVAEKSKSIEETTEVENKVEIPAYIETEITAGAAEKTDVTEDQRHDGDLSVKQDTANSEAVQSVENSYHEEKKVEEKTSETENGEETEVPAKLITQENDAVVEEDQTAAQSVPVAAPRSFTKPVVSADEVVQEKITEQTKTPDVINLVVEDRPESPSQPSAKSTDSVVTVEEAIHEPVISSSKSETAFTETVMVEAVIEEKKPEFVPHSVTKTVTFEVLEQRNEKTVTFTMVNSEASSTFDNTEVKEEVVPTPVYRTESGGTVTLEVELKKLNEEYEELMDMLENKPHASTSQELPPPKTNKVADVVVTLTPSQDLEKRDYVAQPADQPKKKKEKKRHGLFGCCSFF